MWGEGIEFSSALVNADDFLYLFLVGVGDILSTLVMF